MKCVIVGGVAGGATAAARIRRNTEKAEIILFERGEYISYANCPLTEAGQSRTMFPRSSSRSDSDARTASRSRRD